MDITIVGSGSKGNAVLVESGATSILIDAGFSGRQIEERLSSVGKDIDRLDAIFLTHEHNDHIAGAGVLSRRLKIPIYANEGTYRGCGSKLGKLNRREEFATGEVNIFQDLEIRSFPISHDTLDPVGFVISDGRKKFGYLTDTGRVTQLMAARLRGCDALILEFNHDPQMLKNGPYPLPLQQRVRSSQGHLANEDAATFLADLLHEHMQHVVLAHLSETNNLPQLALQAAMEVHSQHPCSLQAASQHQPLHFTIAEE